MATKGLEELNQMTKDERSAYFDSLSRDERMELADRLVKDCDKLVEDCKAEQKRLEEQLNEANDNLLKDLGLIVKAFIRRKGRKNEQ